MDKRNGTINVRRGQKGVERLKKTKRKYVIWVSVCLFFVLAFIRFFILFPSLVTGDSMAPTLLSNDRVLVSSVSQIERFDVVIFQDPTDNTVVKRVIGLPGETVRYSNEQLFINDEPVDEPFLEQEEIEEFSGVWTSDFTLPTEEGEETIGRIPENHYFLMGDNRRFSFDSRFYGSIDEENIIGEVKLVYYPFERAQLK